MESPPKAKIDDVKWDRIYGSMVGMALGDAIGAHVEFRPHTYMVENPVTGLEGGGTWGLKKGQVYFTLSYAFEKLIRICSKQFIFCIYH